MKLYRYIPALDRENGTQLYKGMIENLQCARLRFTNPATLNDPLDGRERGVTAAFRKWNEILMDVPQDIMKHADACAGHHADAW